MRRRRPLRAREVAGVLAVPPAGVTAAATRVRAGLGRAHDRMGLPFQVLLERLTGALDAPALYAYVELGLPETLTSPRTIHDIAAQVGVDPDALPSAGTIFELVPR